MAWPKGNRLGRQWQKGQSGNPNGRPRGVTLSEAYRRMLMTVDPKDPEGRTYGELIALGQARAAIKGSTPAAAEIANRTEGKAPQAIELTQPMSDADLNRLSDAELEQIILEARALNRDGGEARGNGEAERLGGRRLLPKAG